MCRWPNGDVSFVSGSNRLAIDDVLDEVGNPDDAELIPIKHPMAVHFHLKPNIEPHDSLSECLEFEGHDERSYWEICNAYPALHEVLRKENATAEEVAAAVELEKTRPDDKPEDLSDDPMIALIQLQADMPKRLAEHHGKTAKRNAPKKKYPSPD